MIVTAGKQDLAARGAIQNMEKIADFLKQNLELQRSGQADPEISEAVNKGINEALLIFFRSARQYTKDIEALRR